MTMKIKGTEGQNISKIYGQKPAHVEDNLPKDTANKDKDSITISSKVKEVRELVKETLKIDDVRLDRVETVKQKVDAGEYKVSSEEIADAILRHIQEGK